jgi:hypothetical protein
MAKQILKNKVLLLNGRLFSPDVNEFSLEPSIGDVDVTSWADSGKRHQGGIRDDKASVKGFVEDTPTSWAAMEGKLFGLLGLATVDFAAIMYAEAAGADAWIGRSLAMSYKPGGQVGEVFGMTMDLPVDGSAQKGSILSTRRTATLGVVAATGVGAGLDLALTVSATQRLYVVHHVLSLNAGTFDHIVQSDDNVGFTSPTTRATFAQVAAATVAGNGGVSELIVVNGPITPDTRYRDSFTLGGGANAVQVVTLIAIGN